MSLKLQVYFDLSYQNTLKLSLIGISLWAYQPWQGFLLGSALPCRSWLLYACLALFCRNWNVAFLYQWYVGTCLWKYPWKIGDKIEWSSFGFTLFYGFIVWLWWSWSLASFAIMLSYADWDSREKEAQRLQNVWPLGQWVKWNIITESQPNLLSLWLKIRLASKEFTSIFSLSTPDYFYWQLERKTSPYISVSLYENIDDLYVRNDFVTGWLLFFRTIRKCMFRLREKKQWRNSCGGFKAGSQ